MSSAVGIDLDGWQRLVDGLREAVLVVDPAGVVRVRNAAAADRFPRLCLGERFDVHVAGRQHDLGEGWSAWYFTDSALDHAHLRLAGGTSREVTLKTIVQLAAELLGEHCVAVVPATRDRLEWWQCGGGEPSMTRTPRRASTLTDVLTGTSTLTRITSLGEGSWGVAEDFGCALAVPLGVGGALVVLRRGDFAPHDVERVRLFGKHAAVALESASKLTEQQRTIEVLRSALLPLPLPEVRGVTLASVFIPAHQRALVGGDFYDVHPRTDGTATFALGDVCGHGLEAAVHSGRVRQSLQALSLVETNPVRLLHLLNTSLRATGSKLFTTIVVGELVPLASGGVRLSLASGGHPAPLILRADGTVQEVSAPGAIVGILSDVRFHGEQVTLAPGDTLVLYSDGFTEARAHADRTELFGEQRLRTVLKECKGLSAEEIARHCEEAVLKWLDRDDHDDLALLAVQAV
ncbi:PP2C family protein-serine/threonine phosphatase [Lentzea aerocolonigenes]|uniref:PP2C family protein-serine/threonine phosphatase n=1 Tax=Lentzea aerocolonigenes TaxID=68170 RepID=UPI0004C3CEFC|nr:PP2C family protein-serine/threonine phosphatase [Lentzea aerocolonigenes]MCP2244973.1 Serine phosphatase RsbU, regulator of sigma subunit [Lentzea aerocolonigenes]